MRHLRLTRLSQLHDLPPVGKDHRSLERALDQSDDCALARQLFGNRSVVGADNPEPDREEKQGMRSTARAGVENRVGAKRCPAGANDVIEIRQVHEREDFGPEVAREERELKERVDKTKR